MVIIEDTRQQVGKHDHKAEYFEKQGIEVVRSKLPFGDYALMIQVAIDTKKDIYELAQDIDQDHQRFKRELVSARDSGCKLYILVENCDGVSDLETLSTWRESTEHFAMRRRKTGNPKCRYIEGKRLAKACQTMSERYGATFLFCPPEKSGWMIETILGREEAIRVKYHTEESSN